MKFMCLGYMSESKWQAMSKSEQDAMVNECLAYDEVLKKDGQWTGEGEALQLSRSAKTLRLKEGKLIVTDGPYAETKEQLGGFGFLEADDIDHAVRLMSHHPGVKYGPFEIRPIDQEMTQHCAESIPQAEGASSGGVKVICLGYGDESSWDGLTANQRDAALEECVSYGKVLSEQSQWVGGVALQSSKSAKTLRNKAGKVSVTDGPFAETKEQLGGAAIFRFQNMDQAIEAWSRHPCLRMGDVLELRPADEEFMVQVAARLEAAAAK
jgi:hypothetical protein